MVELETRILPWSPAFDEVGEQVDRAGRGKAVDGNGPAPALEGLTRFRVERVQEEARCADEDDASTVQLGIRDALPVVVPHRVLPAGSLGLLEGPERCPRSGIERDHRPLRTGGSDQLPAG